MCVVFDTWGGVDWQRGRRTPNEIEKSVAPEGEMKKMKLHWQLGLGIQFWGLLGGNKKSKKIYWLCNYSNGNESKGKLAKLQIATPIEVLECHRLNLVINLDDDYCD